MIIDLGLTDYEQAYRAQLEFVARRKLGEIEDTLLITEHNPVFTIGRTGSKESLLVDEKVLAQKGIKVLSVDRGGDITFHGPGQLVAYPIIDLKASLCDLHRYLRYLEEAVILFLKRYSVAAGRITGKTGVWVQGRKIASLGIGASGWVTYHGLSININVDLSFFAMIYPCGMKSVETISLNRILGKNVAMDEAKRIFVAYFQKVFNLGDICYRDRRKTQVA
ncbi:MAG: lipoyl(octanoyl) transferase LipB [Candidatus Omnitrophica bacterium]|nr:lipoyl(octanoyl) transferase LipB [Candidatus Omnitrophota bacterium]